MKGRKLFCEDVNSLTRMCCTVSQRVSSRTTLFWEWQVFLFFLTTTCLASIWNLNKQEYKDFFCIQRVWLSFLFLFGVWERNIYHETEVDPRYVLLCSLVCSRPLQTFQNCSWSQELVLYRFEVCVFSMFCSVPNDGGISNHVFQGIYF